MDTVIPTEQFEKDVKYYIKKKGFTHIGADIKAVTDELQILRQDSLIGIVLFTMQFGMMRKCIY